MNYKNVSMGMVALFTVLLVSSFSNQAPAKKFSPVGTWEYSAPDVPDGYQEGSMIIVEKDKTLGITMVMNEYTKIEGEKVEYSKKNLKFVFWVESEEIVISGTFQKDNFTGTVSMSGGVIDITAVRI